MGWESSGWRMSVEEDATLKSTRGVVMASSVEQQGSY
jgi:hypothetical protein